MKRILLIIGAVISFGIAQAQSNLEEVQIIQSMFGAEKKAIVAEFIKPEGAMGGTFWGLYDQYEMERKALGLVRLDLIKTYADNYLTLTDEQMNQLIKDMMTMQKKTDGLINTYYKKINKACGAKISAQFFQIEGYFLSAIRASIMEQIPVIGEMEEHVKKN